MIRISLAPKSFKAIDGTLLRPVALSVTGAVIAVGLAALTAGGVFHRQTPKTETIARPTTTVQPQEDTELKQAFENKHAEVVKAVAKVMYRIWKDTPEVIRVMAVTIRCADGKPNAFIIDKNEPTDNEIVLGTDIADAIGANLRKLNGFPNQTYMYVITSEEILNSGKDAGTGLDAFIFTTEESAKITPPTTASQQAAGTNVKEKPYDYNADVSPRNRTILENKKGEVLKALGGILAGLNDPSADQMVDVFVSFMRGIPYHVAIVYSTDTLCAPKFSYDSDSRAPRVDKRFQKNITQLRSIRAGSVSTSTFKYEVSKEELAQIKVQAETARKEAEKAKPQTLGRKPKPSPAAPIALATASIAAPHASTSTSSTPETCAQVIERVRSTAAQINETTANIVRDNMERIPASVTKVTFGITLDGRSTTITVQYDDPTQVPVRELRTAAERLRTFSLAPNGVDGRCPVFKFHVPIDR